MLWDAHNVPAEISVFIASNIYRFPNRSLQGSLLEILWLRYLWFLFCFLFFCTGFHVGFCIRYLAKGDLELLVLLPPECWDLRSASSPHLA